jgi:hypothetical protein
VRKYIVIIFLLVLSVLFAGSASAFTDEDLEKYKSHDVEIQKDTEINLNQDTSPSQRPVNETAEAESWCDRMTKAKDRLRRAALAAVDSGSTAAGIQGTYGRKYIGGTAVVDSRIEYNKAKDELRAAEDDVKNIEEEAQRKNIPPGWLRCQF